ncbi:hypothetical protein VB773_17550 [Haloarculaceae archaeon H-GB2-1]|nr:hypothetical protein [Haloarculaceae archaeon H-GB2-1]
MPRSAAAGVASKLDAVTAVVRNDPLVAALAVLGVVVLGVGIYWLVGRLRPTAGVASRPFSAATIGSPC